MEQMGFECQIKECGLYPSTWLWVLGLTLLLSSRLLCTPEVIEKFDYVFAENGTVQYKHGRLLSKQVSAPQGLSLQHFSIVAQPVWCLCPGRGRALCPLPSEPCVPCPDHPEPPGGGAAAGLDQLLPPLHGPAQTAQETVRPLPACIQPPHPTIPGRREDGAGLSDVTCNYWGPNLSVCGFLSRVKSKEAVVPDGAGFEFRAILSLTPCPPSYPCYHQWNLHRVPEWHAEHLAHRPELYPGGANRVLRTGQGAANCATLGSRTSVTQPLWAFAFSSVRWISWGGGWF